MQPDLIAFATHLANEAERMLRNGEAAARSARLKTDRTFVTDLDLTIEKHLRMLISVQYPEHGVLGEEEDSTRLDAEWVWVLDPIDGTAPFIAGIPVYGTLIALCQNGAPKLGIMTFPRTGDRWVGVEGENTRHNGHVVHTRHAETLGLSIQSASNPDFFNAHEKQALDALSAATAWRIYGGSALSYGLLASGRIDVAIDSRLKIHDYAAFVPIIEGAGGIITDWHGQPLRMESGPQVLAAGDAQRHAEALALVQKALR